MKITPPEFMAKIEARLKVEMEPRKILSWPWLKIERRWNWKYSGPEYHLTLTLWPFRRPFYVVNGDQIGMARPAFFIVWGRVSCSSTGWHARGCINPTDIKYPKLDVWAQKPAWEGKGTKLPGDGQYLMPNKGRK